MPRQHDEVGKAELIRIAEGGDCYLCPNQEDGTKEQGASGREAEWEMWFARCSEGDGSSHLNEAMEAMSRHVGEIADDPERAVVRQDLVEYLRDEREEHDQCGGLQKREEGDSVAPGPWAGVP